MKNENSYYPFYNLLPLVFTLFFISFTFTDAAFFPDGGNGQTLINKQNGSVWPVQAGSRESKDMFFPNTLRIYTGFNCCCCLCVPGAVKMLAVRMAGIVWASLLPDTGSHVRAIRWLLTALRSCPCPAKPTDPFTHHPTHPSTSFSSSVGQEEGRWTGWGMR